MDKIMIFGITLLSTISFVGLAFLVYYLVWRKYHKRPLDFEEMELLAAKRVQKEIKRVNNQVGKFQSGNLYQKNTNWNPKGGFYSCNIESYKFPDYIASQLHGKKHEWVVFGLVRAGTVIKYWTNKGADRTQVAFGISINEITTECVRNQCTAILDLHNHPNPNPSQFNCLVSSNADQKSSSSWFVALEKYGISLFSFVCERGRWALYYKGLTKHLQVRPHYTTVEYIRNQNGISKKQNLKLHQELGIFHWLSNKR